MFVVGREEGGGGVELINEIKGEGKGGEILFVGWQIFAASVGSVAAAAATTVAAVVTTGTLAFFRTIKVGV